MYFKKLIGEMVYLSPMNPEDCEKYAEWINDIEVSSNLGLVKKQINEFIEREMLQNLSKQEFNFAIVDKKNDEAIGSVGLFQIDYINRSAEVGIFIGNKNYWGKGYGSDALNLMLDFTFNILNFNSVKLKTYSYNSRAINCYKKVGFKEVGALREGKIIAGEKYDIIVMDILSNEFKNSYIKKIINLNEIY